MANDNAAKILNHLLGSQRVAIRSVPFQRRECKLYANGRQGQTLFAAAGDTGAYDDLSHPTTLTVGDPASQPLVTAVGGTSLSTNGKGGSYLSETVWNNGTPSAGAGGGGISSIWTIPSWQLPVGLVSIARLHDDEERPGRLP